MEKFKTHTQNYKNKLYLQKKGMNFRQWHRLAEYRRNVQQAGGEFLELAAYAYMHEIGDLAHAATLYVGEPIDYFSRATVPQNKPKSELLIDGVTIKPKYDIFSECTYEQVTTLRTIYEKMRVSTEKMGKDERLDAIGQMLFEQSKEIFCTVTGLTVNQLDALQAAIIAPYFESVLDCGLAEQNNKIINLEAKYCTVNEQNLTVDAYKSYKERQNKAANNGADFVYTPIFDKIYEFCQIFPAYTVENAYKEKYFIIFQALSKQARDYTAQLNISTPTK